MSDTAVQILGVLVALLGNIIAVYAIVNKKNNSFKENISLEFNALNIKFNEIALQINTILEGDIRELRSRILILEQGQNEWTKILRGRTHELANIISKLQTEIVLLKNGVNPDVAGT